MLLERARRIARRHGRAPSPADFDLIVLLGLPDVGPSGAGERARLRAAWDAPRRLLVAELAAGALAQVEGECGLEPVAPPGPAAWTVAARAAGDGAWWLAARWIPHPATAAAWPLAGENAVDAWRERSLSEWRPAGRRLRAADLARLLTLLTGGPFDAGGIRAAR